MTQQEILDKFTGIVTHSLHVDPALITPAVYLDDVGAESLDMIEIAMEVESQFNIWLPEKSILQTAIEVLGPGVVEQDGHLTEVGKELMRRRLPADEDIRVEGEVTVRDVNRHFMKVSTWLRLISGLLDLTPKTCPVCGGEMAASLGFRMKCEKCGHEVTLRSGDDINREWVIEFQRSLQKEAEVKPA